MPTRDLTIRFLASTGDLSKGVDEVHGKLQGVATSLKGIATAGAVVGTAAFLKSAIDRASGLNETASKISVVFGKGADAVQRFAADSAAAMGQSKQAALDASATFGVFGKSAGLSGSALSGFSTELTKLASDMASFSNSTPQEAIEAIGAALRGEAEPIQRFGVLLDDATLRQEAFKMGLIKSVSEGLTPANKVLAAHKAILNQTKDAQGDFTRTSSGLANQQRIAAAQWEDLTAKVGKMFLPAATAVVTFFNTQLIPAGEKVGEALGKIGEQAAPALKEAGGAVKDLAGWVWDLPAPVQAAAVAFLAWKLAGDKLTAGAGAATDSFRRFGDEVRLQTALAGGEISKASASLAVLESHSPALLRATDAYRTWSERVAGATREHATLIASIGSFDGQMGKIRTGVEATVNGLGRFAGGIAGVTAAAGSAVKTGLGSLVGFLGGPWGVALTAASAGLGFWMQSQAKSRAETERLAAASREYVDVLRAQNGVINESVRKAAAKALEDEGALKLARDLGISLPQVTDAYINQNGALGGLLGRLEEMQRAGTHAIREGGQQTQWMDAQARAAEELRGKMDALGKGAVEAAGKETRLADATRTSAEAMSTTVAATPAAVSSVQVLKDATEGLGLKYDEAARAGSGLASIIKKISDEQGVGIEAEEAYEESLDALTESIKTNGVTLDVHTKAGRDNRDAVERAAQSIRDMTLADLESGAPADQAIARHYGRVNALREEADQSGMTLTEADKLISAYATIPAEVLTYIKTKGYEDVVSKLSALEQQQVRLETGVTGVRSTRGGQQRYAYGGYVTGPGGPRDDKIPALLSNKEFVQNAAATEHYGVSFMHALNERRIPKDMLPRFARGGTMWPFPVDVSHTKIPDVAAGPVGAIQAFARAQAGKRYQWGAVGPERYDCSGLVGAMWAVAQGMNPYQRYMTTSTMGVGRYGMKPGPGVFTVYLGPGHTAANIGGLHAEAYGGNGVPLAIGRVGTPLSYYTQVMHLFAQGGLAELRGSRDARTRSFLERGWPEPSTYDQGGWLPPGGTAVNRGSQPEAVLNPQQSAAFVAGARGGTQVVVNINAPIGSQQELEDWLTKSLDNLRRDGRLP